jgi:hypothetical protein
MIFFWLACLFIGLFSDLPPFRKLNAIVFPLPWGIVNMPHSQFPDPVNGRGWSPPVLVFANPM